MKLSKWCNKNSILLNESNGGAWVITCEIRDVSGLYRLEDYTVTSDVAGVTYLALN